MKWTKFFLEISLQILVLTIVGIAGTYLSDHLSSIGFFGDTPSNQNAGGIDPYNNWGARHYWYFWAVTILCALQVIRIVITVIERYGHYTKKK